MSHPELRQSLISTVHLFAGQERPDFDVITSWVPEKAHVLDLGCGTGDLLQKLRAEKQTTGYGVELQSSNVQKGIEKGLNILQQDLESGLYWFEDQSFDVAILSMTLQAVHQTENMLKEITRVGKRAIISVPNFGYWQHRLSVVKGRMPVSKTLPYQWYNTPNVRVLTLADFVGLSTDIGCRVIRQKALHNEKAIDFLPNWRASLGIFEIERNR